VDDAAGLVQQNGVVSLVVVETTNVVRRDVVYERHSALSSHFELAHVADVEEAGGLPDGEVLRDGSRVLDGHVPAGEFDHSRSEASMDRVERRFLDHVPRSNRFMCALTGAIRLSERTRDANIGREGRSS